MSEVLKDQWLSIPYEQRRQATEYLFGQLVEHAAEGGSFRYLIEQRLGFETDAYVPLLTSGGMTISNEFCLSPFQCNDKEVSDALKVLSLFFSKSKTDEAEAFSKAQALLVHYTIKSQMDEYRIKKLKAELTEALRDKDQH